MPVRLSNQNEPIPGYRLLERLGRGGFGEVWKAEAPGGLFKAIKFVYGDLEGAGINNSGVPAEQELKALNRVKTVRHPYLLSLERVDIIEGQLIIVMELADRNLMDRFKECNTQGLVGVPREELLRYLEEAAEALDLMNIEYQLQHLDIKPQNLFLVRNHIKVADFGLCKDLQDFKASVTGGVTPLYAAPETFEGWVSRNCDQYSLAIVYQELLTGQRPFDGGNARQLLMQHVTQPPDLSPLPEGDRAAIGRALSKKPEARFPSCTELLQALRAASGREPAPPAGEPPATIAGIDTTRQPLENDDLKPPPGRAPSRSAQAITRNIVSPVRPGASLEMAKTPPRPAAPAEMRTPRPTPAGVGPAAPEGPDTRHASVGVSGPVEFKGTGVLFPAVVVGLGRWGIQVIQRLRQALRERHGTLDSLPHLRLLAIDTDPDEVNAAMRAERSVALGPRELLLARLNRPSHYLKPHDTNLGGGQPAIMSWLDPKMLYRMPRNQTSGGVRVLGRLAFVDNYREISGRLHDELKACGDPEALATADKATKLGLRTNRPRVYVIAGLGGGTGSGMFIDLAYTAHVQLRRLGYAVPEVVGLFFLPTVEANRNHPMLLGNAFAALTELRHFGSPGATFTAQYEAKQPAITSAEPPFQRYVLLPQEAEEGAPQDLTGLAAGFLLRDLLTPLGRTADAARGQLIPATKLPRLLSDARVPPICQTIGMYRLSWPRQLLIERSARRIAQRIVEHWTDKDSGPIKAAVENWVKEQWSKRQLESDHLIACLMAGAEGALDQVPEKAFLAAVEPLAKSMAQGQFPDPTVVRNLLGELEGMVGRPEGQTPMTQRAVLTEALDDAAKKLLGICEQKLAEMAVYLVEQPRFRFAGADEAIRQIGSLIQRTIERQEPLLTEYLNKSNHAHSRVLASIEALAAGPKRKGGPPTDLPDLLRFYPANRYKALVLQRLLTVYRSLQGNCPEYLREFTYCRARLNDLIKNLQIAPAASAGALDLGPGKHLFPAGCRSLDDAVQQLVRGIDAEELLQLDQKAQAVVQKNFKALAHVCTTPTNNIVRDVEQVLLQELTRVVAERLGASNAVETFLSQFSAPDAARNQLAEAFQDATPLLEVKGISSKAQIGLLIVPADPQADQFRSLAQQTLPDAELAAGLKADDLIFYREVPGIDPADLPQLGPESRAAYEKMAGTEHFTPHSRCDITAWKTAGE